MIVIIEQQAMASHNFVCNYLTSCVCIRVSTVHEEYRGMSANILAKLLWPYKNIIYSFDIATYVKVTFKNIT